MKVMYDYSTQINNGEFKRNVSLIAGKEADKIKHGPKDVVKVCNIGIALVTVEPNNTGANTTSRDLSRLN